MLQYIILLIVTNFAAIWGWVSSHNAAKRKINAEADIKVSDAKLKELSISDKIIEQYKEINAEIRLNYEKRLKDLELENKEIRKEIDELKKLKCYNTSCKNRKQ